LISERRFDPANKRHRRLLAEDELPDGAAPALVQVQSSYRGAVGLSSRLFLVRRFATLLEN
jgi:hypothetical protein